jgi:hypothetical protein
MGDLIDAHLPGLGRMALAYGEQDQGWLTGNKSPAFAGLS